MMFPRLRCFVRRHYWGVWGNLSIQPRLVCMRCGKTSALILALALASACHSATWYALNVQKPFENMVRQAVRKHGMNETAISTEAIDDIDREVSTSLEAHLKTLELPVRLIDVTVGRANPPDAVKHQRIETASQEQRANTEKQRKLAEDQRREAELARAAADNAYREAMRMSPEQFIALEAIKIQREICAKSVCTFVAPGIASTLAFK